MSATIPIGADTQPYGVAITPNGAFAYVTNYQDDSVSVINTTTNIAFASILAGDGPMGVAITPDGTKAYVTNIGSFTVSVI